MIPTSQTVVVSTQPLINDTSFLVILGIFIILFIYLIVREFRLMKVSKHNIQLEQDKLKIIQMDAATKAYPFTRLSGEQTAEIRDVEDENITLETNIFARKSLWRSDWTGSRIMSKSENWTICWVRFRQKRKR